MEWDGMGWERVGGFGFIYLVRLELELELEWVGEASLG